MGWGNCGEDSKGSPIGYLHPATCDHPGCNARIDRGLSYACGGMHGQNEADCEGYFCGQHLRHVEDPAKTLLMPQLCFACAEAWEREMAESADG
jgi:hypothetical protein